MNEYLSWIIAALAAVASWYCYRWGHDDGRAEGYAVGVSDTVASGMRNPAMSGGPMRPDDWAKPDLSGGPRERA